VHANPLRAGMVDSLRSLARFPWCGHGALAGERAAAPFHAVGAALLWFDANPAQARARLREWMDLAALEPDRLDASKPHDETPAFAGLVALRDRLCALHGVDRAALASGARDRATSRVRREVACAGVTRFGLAATQVASLVGASRQAVRSAALRAREDGRDGVSG